MDDVRHVDLTIPMLDRSVVTVSGFFPMTEANFQHLLDVLTVMRPGCAVSLIPLPPPVPSPFDCTSPGKCGGERSCNLCEPSSPSSAVLGVSNPKGD